MDKLSSLITSCESPPAPSRIWGKPYVPPGPGLAEPVSESEFRCNEVFIGIGSLGEE